MATTARFTFLNFMVISALVLFPQSEFEPCQTANCKSSYWEEGYYCFEHI